MAGSYDHIVNDRGEFIGTKYIDNLGDAQEALEECYYMIQYLAENEMKIQNAIGNAKIEIDNK